MSMLDFDGDEDWDREIARIHRHHLLISAAKWLALLTLCILAGIGAGYLTA